MRRVGIPSDQQKVDSNFDTLAKMKGRAVGGMSGLLKNGRFRLFGWVFALGLIYIWTIFRQNEWIQTDTARAAADGHLLAALSGTSAESKLSVGGKTLSRLLATPLGSLGPKGSEREHLLYYDILFQLTLQFGRNAKSVLEVGCASDPFLQYLSWIDHRTCVAPYKVQYKGGNKEKAAFNEENEMEFVEADFMKFKLKQEKKYDLLVCSQVVEHVRDPSAFMKKLIESAEISIISVPYMWPVCGKECHHISHGIDLDMIQKWTAPYVPKHYAVIKESTGQNYSRIITVFEN